MGSAAPNPQYSFLRECIQPATAQSGVMDSNQAKGKAPATSVYPSPADEVLNTFSAPSSPASREQQVSSMPSTREKVTLPPISSIVQQMPSPSSSPQLPLASYRSPSDAFLKSPIKFGRNQDHLLFPDRLTQTNESARSQPLFEGPAPPLHTQPTILTRPDQQHFTFSAQRSPVEVSSLQPSLGNLSPCLPSGPVEDSHQQRQRPTMSDMSDQGSTVSTTTRSIPHRTVTHPPGRKPKRRETAFDIHMRRPVSPSETRFGRNDLWARQIADPQTYVVPVIREWDQTFRATRDILPTPTFPIASPPGMLAALEQVSPSDAVMFTRRHSTAVGRSDQQEKRQAVSGMDMPPPKRTRKTSASKAHQKSSVSPREAPLGPPEKKFRRRTNDPNKAKTPADKVPRDYNIYPDYCPPLSTLDDNRVNFPNIEWKATPQDVTHHQDSYLLHPKEIPIVSKLVLTPSDYLYIKRRFFASRLDYARRHQPWNINAAQLACKGEDAHHIIGIDVNKTSRLHKAFEKVGWLDDKHMERFL